MLAREGDGVEDDVRAAAEHRPELRIVRAIKRATETA